MRYQRIPIKQLTVDSRYQRELDPKRVEKMDREFDDRLLGTLEVSARKASKWAVFDGQHRLRVLRRRKAKDVACICHTNLSPQEEADLFNRLNRERKAPSQLERFHARLFAQDPDAIALNALVEGRGYRIHKDEIAAVGALERSARKYGVIALDQALGFVRGWNGDDHALSGYMIEGVARLFCRWGDRITPEADDRILEYPPMHYVRKARGDMVQHAANQLPFGIEREMARVGKLRGRPQELRGGDQRKKNKVTA